MDILKEKFNKEPAVIIGAISAIIIIILGMLPQFFPQIDSESANVLIRGVQSITAVIGVLLTRSKVSSPATVEKLKEEAQRENIV